VAEELDFKKRCSVALAAVGAGLLPHPIGARQMVRGDKTFAVNLGESERQSLRDRWNDAVQRARVAPDLSPLNRGALQIELRIPVSLNSPRLRFTREQPRAKHKPRRASREQQLLSISRLEELASLARYTVGVFRGIPFNE